MKILIVEDDKDIREIIEGLLHDDGYEVRAYENANHLGAALAEFTPDLLLIDQLLPGKSGVTALREIRRDAKWARLPVIMVTGVGAQADKILALDSGADDYVTKPFDAKELSARVKALIRRSRGDSNPVMVSGRVRIDHNTHKAFLDTEEIDLTLTEFRILGAVISHSGQVLTRDRLRETALGNLNVSDRTIDVHMASLRKKLKDVGPLIETVRGVGYRFDP